MVLLSIPTRLWSNFFAAISLTFRTNWVDLLPRRKFAKDTAINPSSGMSSCMVKYGFQPAVLPESFLPQDIPTVEDHLRYLRCSWVRIQ